MARKILYRLWQRRRVVATALAMLAVGGWLLLSRYGILTRLELEQTSLALDHAIIREQRSLDSLRRYRARLLSDTILIEQLARERYGMVRPGEIVIIIADSSN
ncbi:MAG: septum formation initiator family protein [Bacteroidota bacterium]|nr:septum formation initiator family protein [Candidatus Kapabacteria bacterium]MCS7303209.1 septum formation initiator family protein [Candidatus Kapabacteria bacterium]MCX7936729.1 septum formation initiator family protein [Chlorobiota bacterium]MDW8074227.1 septum formation initiator family protein [Bacteroidota bacterium]MDW8271297.1 septum formation initiator family protein [Bacteroidota bacterium]